MQQQPAHSNDFIDGSIRRFKNAEAASKAVADASKPKGTPHAPSIDNFTKTKKVQMRARIDDCLATFRQLAAHDLEVDRLRAKAGGRAALFFVLAFLGVFGSIVITGATDGKGAPAFIAPAVLVVFAIKSLIKYFKFKKMDILNEFRLCLVPLLDTLVEDIDPRERIEIDADLSGPVKTKITSEKQLDPKLFNNPRLLKIKQTIFHDPWLKLELPLLDGNVILVQLDNFYFRYDRTQRGTSGKTKFKTKWKKRTVARARVLPDASEFAWDEAKVAGQPPERKLKLADKKGVRCCRVTRKFKFSSDDGRRYVYGMKGMKGGLQLQSEPNPLEDSVAPEEIFGLLMELFALLKPVEARN